MKTFTVLMRLLVVALLTAPASMAFAAAAPTPAAHAQTAPATPVARTPQKSLASDYAAREKASAAKVEGFQGGGAGIYIGGSGVAVVLIIVLLIILI